MARWGCARRRGGPPGLVSQVRGSIISAYLRGRITQPESNPMSTALLIIVMYLGTGIQPLIYITQEPDMNTCHDSRASKVQQLEMYNRTHPNELLHHWVVMCLDISEIVRPRWSA